ncbi:polymerase [Horseshoe bat hepatitis B virus]|uniref:Protein P n=1 Tax=Horseshoe bat hepatitis B virus TaxID=1508711 RepID=U3MBX0_9HEPA|nr:polymerase [Horseshoe bat hepatitis B virus]AGW01281.1 polymerase [Horseshoe bat hepatitis B virus]
MHPFYQLFQSTQSLGEEEIRVLLGPPEGALPLLADADLNLRVAGDLNLQLPPTASVWVHKAGGLTGLYSDKPKRFNADWKTPEFPRIHLRPDLISYLTTRLGPLTSGEKRRFRLCLPARFFPKRTKYFPLTKAIKPYYPNNILTHFFLTSHYLRTLWKTGVTYLRETHTTASFNGLPYPWEQKQQSHGSESISHQPSGLPPGPRYDNMGHDHLQGHPPGVVLGRPSGGIRPREKETSAVGNQGVPRSLGPVPSPSTWRHLRDRGKRPGNSYNISWGRHRHKNCDRPKAHQNYSKSDLQSRRVSHPSVFGARHQTRNYCATTSSHRGGQSSSFTASTPRDTQSQPGEATNTHISTHTGNSPTSEHEQPDVERAIRASHLCPWLFLRNNPACGPHCLRQCTLLLDDWGPCHQHGEHLIRTPRTPRRISGGVFLVDKNPNNRAESRLVVDFSQFSRGDTRVLWPKFAVPNLQALTNLLSTNLFWLSLDVSAAFYHIPLSPAAMPHLLVGSPGLEGLAASMSPQSSQPNHDEMRILHNLCGRDNLLSLLLLFKTYGRQLHLLAHSYIMGFRKIPMGVGLSPFLLAQFTSALASVVRRTFTHCVAFSYMDDVVLGARTPEHLESVYASVCALFSDLGIHLNPDKTKWWGKHLNFMGLEISPAGALPQHKHQARALQCLKTLPTYRVLDWKLLQRLTGLLGFLAPFTACGYPALMPLYGAIHARRGFEFSPAYKGFLLQLYSHLLPVARQRRALCQVFADATPTGWGLVNHQLAAHRAGRFPRPLPIHCAELIAACLARRWSGARVLGVDNTIVCSGKFTHFPWLLGCTANWMLRGTSFCYVPSELNPADAPSRGLLGILLAPPPLLFRPSTGRTSLFAVSPPAPSHRPGRVSFASPVRIFKDTWRPP